MRSSQDRSGVSSKGEGGICTGRSFALFEQRSEDIETVRKQFEAGRLEAHGFGLEQPIEDNNTEVGRAANRRVEFKIVEEEDSNKVKK